MKINLSTRNILTIYWEYTRRYMREFLTGSIGSALAVIVQSMIPPLIVATIFRKLQASYTLHQHLSLRMFLPYIIGFVIAMLLGVILWRLQSYAVWNYEVKVRRDMANDIFDHLQYQDQRFHSDRFGGSLVSQTNKFIGSGERLMDDFIWNIIPSITTLVVALAVLAVVAWPFAIVLLFIVSIYFFVMSRRIVKQLQYNATVAELESKQTGALADALTNVTTIKGFAHEKYESKRFAKTTQELLDANNVLSVEILKSEAMSQAQTNGFQVVAIIAGLMAITTFNLNASLLYLILTYTQSITSQLLQFSRLIRNVNRSLGDATEMAAILQITPEIKDPESPLRVRMHRGEIKFNNISFAYPENLTTPLFKNFDLKIKPGEKVGLVGPSGGGKTTITRLLLRFMDTQEGSITIDGQDIKAVKQTDLRTKISYVSQEPMLFHRTLKENIAYGDQTAQNKAIFAVAKMAHAHDFITNLNDGYETLVGERGVKLSGGQRQRIAIARAMLKNAPILVLDEATSALDSESEVLIQDALWRLMEGKTALVIAHRLSTIQKMDRILVLEDGKLIEQGSHKDLLFLNGVYAKLWAHQSGGFIED